jgi:hypothetical protein
MDKRDRYARRSIRSTLTQALKRLPVAHNESLDQLPTEQPHAHGGTPGEHLSRDSEFAPRPSPILSTWVEHKPDEDTTVRLLQAQCATATSTAGASGLIRDYFEHEDEDPTLKNTESERNSEKDFEVDESDRHTESTRDNERSEKVVINQQLGDLLRLTAKELESEVPIPIAVFDNIWWWMHFYKRDFIDDDDDLHTSKVR